MSSSFDFFSPSVFLKFAIRLVVVKDSAVWSLNIFENFKKLVQKIQTNNSKQSSKTQTWTEQCFIRSLKYKSVRKNSVRQNEPSKTKFCNSLLSLKIRKKMPFGRTNPQKRNFVIRCCPWISEKNPLSRTNPQKRNFVIRCCPWIYKKGGVRRGLLVLSLNAALLSVSCVRRGLWEDYWKNSLKQNSIFQIVLSQPSPYTLRCCQCGI